MKKIMEQKESGLIYDACMHIRLISDLEVVNRKISFLSELSSEDFLPLNQKLKFYQTCLYKLSGNSQFQEDLEASGVSNSISELVRDMQFHDVIQQKLEHIKIINNEIAKELNKVNYDESYLEKTKYIKIIPLLSRINLIQLYVINSEYREVVNNLRKTITSIDHYMKVAACPSPVFFFTNARSYEELTEVICGNLKRISKMTYSNHNLNNNIVASDLEYVTNVYTMKSERDIFNKVFELSNIESEINIIKDIVIKEINQQVNDGRLELF
jgi:hypothetical protein